MLYYINKNSKRLVTRNNGITTKPFVADYNTVEEVSFQIIDDQNKIVSIDDSITGYYFAGSIKMNPSESQMLWLSHDYTIENDIITFQVNTYTSGYFAQVKKKFTEVAIELGIMGNGVKQVILRNDGLACPRVYIDGVIPEELDDFYTKEEIDEMFADLNPAFVQIEEKTLGGNTAYTVDFSGKQIQKYAYTDASSGAIEIDFEEFISDADDISPTIELHIPSNGDIDTITIPASLNIVKIPDSLIYKGQTENDIQYNSFVLRAEKNMNGIWKYYINYAYSYIESLATEE